MLCDQGSNTNQLQCTIIHLPYSFMDERDPLRGIRQICTHVDEQCQFDNVRTLLMSSEEKEVLQSGERTPIQCLIFQAQRIAQLLMSNPSIVTILSMMPRTTAGTEFDDMAENALPENRQFLMEITAMSKGMKVIRDLIDSSEPIVHKQAGLTPEKEWRLQIWKDQIATEWSHALKCMDIPSFRWRTECLIRGDTQTLIASAKPMHKHLDNVRELWWSLGAEVGARLYWIPDFGEYRGEIVDLCMKIRPVIEDLLRGHMLHPSVVQSIYHEAHLYAAEIRNAHRASINLDDTKLWLTE